MRVRVEDGPDGLDDTPLELFGITDRNGLHPSCRRDAAIAIIEADL